MGTYQDIVYMRYMKQGKVLRVARADTIRGLVLALYPSDDRDIFHTEAFCDIDDESERKTIKRGTIKDTILLKLLDGESHKEIVQGYEPFGAGYSYCRKGTGWQALMNHRSFRIAEDKEEPISVESRA